MARASENQYYTVPQAAQMLQISATTVWRWIQAGKLRAFRVGPKSIRIRKEDWDAVITPFRPEPEVEPAAEPKYVAKPVSEEELARRQALVAKILENSEERDISPLTSADLIHKVRREAMKKFGKAR